MSVSDSGVFRSLRSFNYRVWAAGALVSNVGTWIQRTAQDWLVLTQLTHHDASAVGIVMSLQFGPQLLLLPWTGYAADRFNQRRLLMATQALMGGLALVLGVLTATGIVRLWHVYVFAFLFGCASAFDAPVRQTFVAELVGDRELANAVALNSTSFNAARMIGPAVAGFIIASVGTGWAFLINGISFVAVLASLSLLRVDELRENVRAGRATRGLLEGFRYVWHRADLKAALVMLFLIGTFGLNFPLFISTMAAGVFHVDARGFGILSSMMAVGTISGALLAARRDRPRFRHLWAGAATFGVGCTLGAIAPGYWPFAAALVLTGIAAMTFTNSTNALMQLSTEPPMRGRVMALRLAVAVGGTPLGAPVAGWVANHLGPRWALGVGAASGFAAALVALYFRKRVQAGHERAGARGGRT
ncbi:MFS transporter [Burkholderia dolosa]|uniref:MFS transporter n=1 Tax=Burkholderia dolosa TaxID=152500 RepID=A0A892IAZ7_9BURK|nr:MULTISPECIES: MFS transporter [Burkholderia]AKE05860.1 MFS transporter [Burkholderia cepacia]AJY10521.1 major Facilitator Superfamily protein [Burkholderia dolosa AU0158]AYZ93809.1 MFS transporter [Burkholderia dolosa]ETP62462.1 MFS transporter [Burkholderia dolosa PC543]MBR8059644.1 MFS transporter [Burkholderia dolosa]